VVGISATGATISRMSWRIVPHCTACGLGINDAEDNLQHLTNIFWPYLSATFKCSSSHAYQTITLPASAMDITTLFSKCLPADSPPLKDHAIELSTLNAFLQEAYRINRHISDLTKYLRSIRAPYLALGTHNPQHTATSRHTRLNGSANSSRNQDKITDADRGRIEEETKGLISGLSRAIRELSDAANADVNMSAAIAERQRNKRGLGALGRWAAGGGMIAKSPEEILEDEKRETLRLHREGVLWFLQKRLEVVSEQQRSMVEVRLQRAVEKNKSMLYKAGLDSSTLEAMPPMKIDKTGGINGSAEKNAVEIEQEAKEPSINDLLSPEQVQMFEEEQEDIVKYYNSELQKIRFVVNAAFHTATHNIVDQFKTRSPKSPHCKPSWPSTLKSSPRTSPSWSQTQSRRHIMLIRETKNSRRQRNAQVPQGWSLSLHVLFAPLLLFGI